MKTSIPALCVLVALSTSPSYAQSTDAGRVVYASRCASCHGTTGGGGELGPTIVMRVPARTDAELTSVIQQGLPTAGMPAFGNLSAHRNAGPDRVPPIVAPSRRVRAGADESHADDGHSAQRVGIEPGPGRSATAGRRSKAVLLRKEGRDTAASPHRPTGRATTVRPREPAQRAHADRQKQCRAPGAEVDLQPAEHVDAAGDAGRGRRRDVRDERQPVLRARRRHRARDLALLAPANERPHRQRGGRHQPRRRQSRAIACSW